MISFIRRPFTGLRLRAGVHPDLVTCMRRVYLRGCEAAYLASLVRTADFCESLDEGHQDPTQGPSTVEPITGTANLCEGNVQEEVVPEKLHAVVPRNERAPRGSAGSLVMHLRSGDIFNGVRHSRTSEFGQVM